MSTTINYIGDSFVAPSNVDGDEDLYIADDLEVGGSAFKPGGGVWTTASDQRLKREIKSFNTGLDAVLAIEPVTFVYNDRIEALNTGETYVGILAQDMLEIAPHTISLEPFGRVVVETDDGTEQVMDPGEEFYTYDASSLPYMLINAVQEQQDMIDQQQATIESQNELIQELLERVEALEEN